MNQSVVNEINNINMVIDDNISEKDYLNRGLLSQNILAQLRNLVEDVIVLWYNQNNNTNLGTHFEDKKTALTNIFNTLNENGIFKYRNVEPEYMKEWWVYKYCPESYCEDLHRFWPKELLCYELGKAGFSKFSIKRECYETYKNIEELYENYKRRDTSQLAMINENYYQLGLKRIEREILDGVKEYKDVVSFLDIKCERA